MLRPIVAALALSLALPAVASASDIETKESKYSAKETLDRLAKALESKGIKVMARIDHAAGAKAAGDSLPPTELLIFGNPKLGTPLMKANRQIGLDLPMKVLAWTDDKGKTWVAYTKPSALKSRYKIEGKDNVFKTMAGALAGMTGGATGAAAAPKGSAAKGSK